MYQVRDAVSSARNFMFLSSVNPWERICGDRQGVFVSRYMKLFNDYVALQKGDSYERLRSANKCDRKLQSVGDDSSTVSCFGSASSSVVGTPVSGVELGSAAGPSDSRRLHSSIGSLLGRSQSEKKNDGTTTVVDKKKSNNYASKKTVSKSKVK